MTLPTYQSVQEVLEDVKAMRPLGGSAYGHSAASAFKLTALDPSLQTANQLFTALDHVAEALLAEKPTMATIHNARWLIVEKSRQSATAADLGQAKAAIIKRADLFIERSATALERVGQVGGNLIEEGQTIMMHSFSRSLMTVFDHARQAGKSFRVICTQSQPTRESRFALHHLTKLGIEVTFGLDAAMAVILPQADWCLAGADSIGIDGAVANKVGTYQLALLAHSFAKPLYIASEIIKLQRDTMEGHPIPLEHRPAAEILDMADYESPAHITVHHQFFDLTPASLIRSLITEDGVIAPAGIGAAWSKIDALFDDVSN